MPDAEAYRFGAFRLLPQQRELLMRGAPVDLGPRGFDLLVALVKRHGQLATKDALMAEVWPGIVVGENNLPAQVSALRRLLAVDAECGRCLQTVPGRGYRFVARVEFEGTPDAAVEIAGRPGETNARLSLVVLPFTNLSSDPEQAYFVQGMSETITTDLSRISGLLVIAFATAATFKDEPGDPRQVCRALNVRFCVRGSVQRSGKKVRINAQLVDSVSGLQVWSERFDGHSSDLFALQDQITGRIANSVGREINHFAAGDAEMRKANPDATDLLMRGIAIADWPQSLGNLRQQELLFGQAVQLDPGNSEAHARLARAILLQLIQVHASLPMQIKAEKLKQGAHAAERAVELDPNNARAHLASGLLHMARGEFAEAVLANETAIALDRNLALAHSNLGNSLVHLGQAREALPALGDAIRLDPLGPQISAIQSTMGFARLFLEENQSAADWYTKAKASNPRMPRAHAGLAIALALLGNIEGARRAAADLRRLVPDYRISGTIDAPSASSPLRYRQFYEEVLCPAAKVAGVQV